MAAQAAWNAGSHLEAGQLIFQSLTSAERVAWAMGILRFCSQYSAASIEIDNVLNTADSKSKWSAGHEAFSRVRRITLAAEQSPGNFDPCFCSLLYVAENTAKVIYNATSPAGPFDEDAGWWVAPCLHHFLSTAKLGTEIEAGAMRALFWSVNENAV